MGTHMGDSRRLSSCSNRRYRGGAVRLTRWYATDESEADPVCDTKVTMGESPSPGDELMHTAISW
jgi:hypothetical protein